MQNGNGKFDFQFIIKRAQSTRALSDFYCGIEIMDDFIHNELQDEIATLQDLFIVYEKEKVVAMFCLANSCYYISNSAKEKILSSTKPEPKPGLKQDSTFWEMISHPSVEITYFAVKEELRNQGIGRFLVEEIIRMLSSSSLFTQPVVTVRALQTVGGKYSAVGFYQKCGFSLAEDIVPDKNIFMYRVLPKH